MSTHAAPWLAWSFGGLSLVLTALSLFLFALNLSYSGAHVYDYWLQNAVQAGSFSIIGAIIASRLPANPVGWLFCAAACTIAVACLSAEYAIYTLVARPDSLPAGEALAWFAFSWWPHDNLHISVGNNLQGLLFIEYGFHVTLMIAALVLAYCFLTLIRQRSDVMEPPAARVR